MQKMARWLVVGICVVLLCRMAAAGEMDPVGTMNLTVISAPPPDGYMYYIGETVQFSGINLISNKTYVRIVNYVLKDDDPQLVFNVVNGHWSGSYVHSDPNRSGRSQLVVKPYSDEEASAIFLAQSKYPDQAFAYYQGYPGIKPTPTPTPSPAPTSAATTQRPTPTQTVNLSKKIADVESRVSEQNESIAAVKTKIAEQSATIAAHDTMITEIIAATPTDTPNYSATIATLQTKLAEQEAKNIEQDSWIDTILRFLGLK